MKTKILNDDVIEVKVKKKKFYWDDAVEQSIVNYILETNQSTKNKIFEKELYKPINKLIESIANRYKLFNFEHDGTIDDIKQQCIVHIIEGVLPKYGVGRNKSYAYIGTSVRRFLIQKIMKYADKEGKNVCIDSDLNDVYGDGDKSLTKDNNVMNSIKYSYNIDDENISADILKKFIFFLKEEVELLEPTKERTTKSWIEFLNSVILICETNHGISFVDNKIIFYNSLKKINGFSNSKNYKYIGILKDRYKHFLKLYLTNN